ncbi:MAG: TolC family protein [Verrucomicrobia bacterium]|nr:TolC family protein [Verrucomicrobiota bacterium]
MSKAILLSAICLFSAQLLAGEVESIEDLVQHALAVHPDVQAHAAERDVAQAEAQQAALRPNPEFSGSAGLKQVDADDGSDSGYAAEIALTQRIERKGKREARLAIAEGELAEADVGFALFRRELEVEVRRLARAYLIAAADARAADAVNNRSRALIDMLKQRPAAGAAMYLELRMVEATLLDLRAATHASLGRRDEARIALNGLLNRPPDLPLRLVEDDRPPPTFPTLEELSAQLAGSPILLQRETELARLRAEASATVLAAKPDFTTGPFLSRDDAGEQETVLGLSFSMELPWRDRGKGSITAAHARTRWGEAQLAAEQRALQNALAQSVRAHERALAQLAMIPPDVILELRAAAELAERQYRLGAINVQLFLDVQREYLNVQRLRNEAMGAAWDTACDVFRITGIDLGAAP